MHPHAIPHSPRLSARLLAPLPWLTAFAICISAPTSAAQNHFTIDGGSFENNLGAGMAQIGDINGDGFLDLVVGEPGFDGGHFDGGRVQVISGKDGSLIRTHIGSGIGQRLGKYVASAGDHNGDGVADYSGGAEHDNEFQYPTGYVRIWSGVDGSLIREYSSSSNWDFFGSAISSLGDINGDGVDDLIIGAHDDDWGSLGAGAVFVYSGADGSVIHTLRGHNAWDRFGSAVKGCGDINLDGISDFAVSAPNQKAGGKSSGKVFIYSGSTGQQLLSMKGRGANSFFGTTMVCLQDINGDNIPDLAISGVDDSTNILGLHAYLEIRSGSDGAVITTIEQGRDGERFGFAMAAVDINGDGYLDLAVGSPMSGVIGASGLASGKVEVFSGPSGRLLQTLLGSQAFARYGSSISALGDLNGDGIDELVIGSPGDGGGSVGGGEVKSSAPSVFAHLLQPTLFAGASTTLEIRRGAPQATYTVHASLTGPGNQVSPGGLVLDLGDNLTFVGNLNTNILGNGSMSAFVPPSTEGVQVWLQAWTPLMVATMTNAVIQ